MKIQPIDLGILLTDFGQLQRHGVPYGFGAKAEGGSDPRNGHRWNPRSTRTLDTPVASIDNLDCSGAVRYLAYRASGGKLKLPDGSQAQRQWCETVAVDGSSGVRRVKYRDAAAYMTDKRLFIAFIRPGYNGCGPVGHVWFLLNTDDDAAAETIESYGGVGVASRPWNSRVLLREVYSCYELPVER